MSRSSIAATRTRCARLSQNSSAQRFDETLILRRVVRLMLLRGLQCYSDGAPSDSIRVVKETGRPHALCHASVGTTMSRPYHR